MTRQEAIEHLQDQVEKQAILTYEELLKATIETDYDGNENIEPAYDILSPIEYTYCDKCGRLERIDEICIIDYLDYDDENDRKVYEQIKNNSDVFMICDMCYHELATK